MMIMNLRPTRPENLQVVIEEMEDRFSEEEQVEMADIISEVLGRPDGEAERQAMTDNAKEARKEQQDHISQQQELMDTDEL